MLCPNCKHANLAGQKFCGECGASLTSAAPRTDITAPVGAALTGQFNAPVTVVNPPPAPPPPATDWRAVYLHQLFDACNFLPLQALAPGLRASGQRLNLATLYTPLLTLTPEEHDQWTRGERDVDAQARRLSALDQLSRHQKLLLLGDPGFGKSTFVNFVALCLCGQMLGEEHINVQLLTEPVPVEKKPDETPKPQDWTPGALLPVRVLLREFAEALPERGGGADRRGADTLWQFIAGQLRAQSLEEGIAPLKAELQNTGGLILLDGLDEVPAAQRRRAQLIAIVEAFALAFPKCRVLVTGRTYAYRAQDWRLGEFQVAVLSPFNLPQIEAFANGWYTQLAARHKLPAAPEALAQSLLTRVRERPRLRDLAQQPLLLTFMAGLHIFTPLPERRQELYEKIVELLLSEWEQGKFTAPDQATSLPSLVQVLKVSLTDLREALERLAFDAHQTQPADAAHRTADLTDDQLVAALYRLKGPTGEHGDPDTLKAHLKERAGLLIEHGVDRYTFPHRTLQEYLAACHLARLYKAKDIADLARADPDRWREVTLLAGAKLAPNQESLWNLTRKLCPRPVTPTSPAAEVWGAHLAGQLLAENFRPETAPLEADDAQALERVAQALAYGVLPSTLNATERALAGRHLAQLGDPRPEVLTTAQMEFCYVPPGPFVMGEGDEQHRNETVTHGYWLARYPVTNAQFAEFVGAGGYAEKRYWPEAEAADCWREGLFKGRWENDFTSGPEKYRNPFDLSNHPVVGVSWYEALAFCRWLNDTINRPGRANLRFAQDLTGLNYRFTLPTEAEWEKAARGGEAIPAKPFIAHLADGLTSLGVGALQPNPAPDRTYPWTGEFDPNKANAGETQVGATSAVGCFPLGASPYGCLEMAGNVWEWCQSKPNNYPYTPDDGREVMDSSDDTRVVRGGSWRSHQVDARAAFRFGFNPNFRFDYFGFRVCVRPPSL